MSSCTTCGAQLGVGRFCTNCGAPVNPSAPATGPDWHTDTAERRLPTSATDPRTPPSAVAPPPPPRYPMYADEVVGYTPYGPLTSTTAPPATPPGTPVVQAPEPAAPAYEPYQYDYTRTRRGPVRWLLAAVLVVALVGAGWWFLVRGDGSGATSGAGGTTPSAGAKSASSEVDVAGRATAKAPNTAPPNTDVNGDQVSYDASNMLDGVPDTAWRAPGDATGMTLTFTLPSPTVLDRVGLINGYAKTSVDGQGRTFDWYHGNRRINAVVWSIGGTKVRQQLKDDTKLQLLTLKKPVKTSSVELKIVAVSEPGSGTASRNFTAISEVSLQGQPQG